ncbi:MAG: MFS transporter, partial [Candidatus Competibacterales bacterium]
MPQPPESEPRDGRLALGFACVGHGLMHLFAAFYFVIVLELERVWGLPYAEALTLWTPGAALIALGAIPAGWLADRWSTPGMMVVMFIGMGLAAVVCGLATTPLVMGLGLVALGLFCAIYHPVGIPWIVRIARRPGQALGVNGIFGSIGVAGAGLITGWLIDVQGWRAAFVVPGLVSLGLGFALGWCWWRGWVADCPAHPRQHQEPSRGEQWRALGILIVTMSCLGLAFQAMQAALPKVFSLRFSDAWQLDVAGAGYLVGAAFVVPGLVSLGLGFAL